MNDPFGQDEDNDEVHNITKYWPHPTVNVGDMAVGALVLVVKRLDFYESRRSSIGKGGYRVVVKAAGMDGGC